MTIGADRRLAIHANIKYKHLQIIKDHVLLVIEPQCCARLILHEFKVTTNAAFTIKPMTIILISMTQNLQLENLLILKIKYNNLLCVHLKHPIHDTINNCTPVV